MGLRDLFRSKTNKTGTPSGAPAAQERDTGAKDVNGAQESVRHDEGRGVAQPENSAQHQTGQDAARPGAERAAERLGADSRAQQLPKDGPLRNLVDILLSRGADRARLTLVQSGNVMTHQTRQAHGDAQEEVENGTVDQGSPLFEDVADLYTQDMNTPAGPWRQLDLIVLPEQGGQREISVDYAFPGGESRKEEYVLGHAAPTPDSRDSERGDSTVTDRDASLAAGAGTAAGSAAGRSDDDRDSPVAAHDAAGDTGVSEHAATTAEPTSDEGDHVHANGAHPDGDSVRVVDGDEASSAAHGQVVAAAAADPVVVSHDGFNGGETGTGDSPGLADDTNHNDQVHGEPAQRSELNGAAGDDVTERAPGDPAEVSHGADSDLPAHVDESEFVDLSDSVTPPAPTGAGAAALASDSDPSDAPQVARSADVAPSYTAPAEQPSGDSQAEGNLVLSLADVQARLADAQRHLFGENGTARDVSTVLIRVRALGTYYDALTHVRMNGFWDQRGTFDLVPEDLLKVQELKDDSYVEGSGAPLAMMFRFRPGVPPEVSFDYSDEEAFVRYEQRLPGQNYLEELRMFPRTGSNIPQHMNDALQDWNY